MVLEDASVISIGSEPIRLRDSDEVVGWVTGGGYGYAVEKSIAYGYLPVAFSNPGTRLDIEFQGERVNAIVVNEPLWDPDNSRIKG
jgi:4-methylaminobutanoate oxidase (formaldehyde-forming)